MCGEPQVAAECTCTERDFGRCSRPTVRPGRNVNDERDHGDGSDTRQRGRRTSGSLTETRVRDWQYWRERFDGSADRTMNPCSLDGTDQRARPRASSQTDRSTPMAISLRDLRERVEERPVAQERLDVRLPQGRVEGIGSPWATAAVALQSASILCREAAEFGAIWHGCVWSDQTILSKPPRQAGGQDASDDALKLTGDAPVGNWTWHGAAPRTWTPTYADMGATREVVLHIHHPIGGEEIYRATDTYPAGSYDGKTETTVLCTGDRGVVY